MQALNEVLADARVARQFMSWLIGLLSAIALGLAALGVYGILAESVSRRVPGFGIRVALGATPARILRSVLAQGAAIVAAGTANGLAGAAALSGTMAGFVFGVETADVTTQTAGAGVLLITALAACVIPAFHPLQTAPRPAARRISTRTWC